MGGLDFHARGCGLQGSCFVLPRRFDHGHYCRTGLTHTSAYGRIYRHEDELVHRTVVCTDLGGVVYGPVLGRSAALTGFGGSAAKAGVILLDLRHG
jgi:hypothetical protein